MVDNTRRGRRVAAFDLRRATYQRYPWDAWTDGSVWEVQNGRDFTCLPDYFQSSLYRVAKQRGMKVRSRVSSRRPGGLVQFQFLR